jgi:hypothetical protein
MNLSVVSKIDKITHSFIDTMQRKTLTVVPISVPIWWVKIGSKLVRLSAIWSAGLPIKQEG